MRVEMDHSASEERHTATRRRAAANGIKPWPKAASETGAFVRTRPLEAGGQTIRWSVLRSRHAALLQNEEAANPRPGNVRMLRMLETTRPSGSVWFANMP